MKIWKIECCKMCPKIEFRYEIVGLEYHTKSYCHRENKEIKDNSKLPKWCTLPDWKEKNNKINGGL